MNKFTLQNPVNLTIHDRRLLYLLYHMLNNAATLFDSGFKRHEGDTCNPVEVARHFHDDTESSHAWSTVDGMCRQAWVDPGEPLNLTPAPEFPSLMIGGNGTPLEKHSVSLQEDVLQIGCKRIPLGDVKQLFKAMKEAGLLEE